VGKHRREFAKRRKPFRPPQLLLDADDHIRLALQFPVRLLQATSGLLQLPAAGLLLLAEETGNAPTTL